MHRLILPFALTVLTAGAARADDLGGIVDRYVAWRGGAAFEQLRTIHLHASLDTAGLHGTEEVWADRDGRLRIDTDLGVLKQIQTITPAASWDIAPSGQVETLPIIDRQSLGREAALQFADVLRGRGGASARLMASETRDGRVWAVVRVSFSDADTYDAFIDPVTGALDGFRIDEDRQGRTERFADWRMVDGVRLAFSQITKTEAPDGDQTVTVTAAEVNVPIAQARLSRPAPARKAAFANGASSTGWIDFDFFAGNRIFFPARINGHETVVLLDSGATVSGIDTAFAAQIGQASKGAFTAPGSGGFGTMGFAGGLTVQVGNLTIKDINAAAIDFTPVARRIGHPLPFVLGNELFNELAVDIDFARHRIAFRDPDRLTPPAGAAVVPLVRVQGNRAVPLSIEGGPPVEVEFDLGNGSALVVYPVYYQPHRLLEGRRVSQTLAGGVGGFHSEVVANLNHVTFAGVELPGVPAVFSPDTRSDANSNLILGNVGLPILARFRLIVDYSHDRLLAIPYPDAVTAPFVRDRLGLAFSAREGVLVVDFVAPGSPAQAAGFKVGDRIAAIDCKPASGWANDALRALEDRPAGTPVAFALAGGGERRLALADYY